MSSNDDTEIQTLHGEDNFYIWKATVKLHLVSLDLWNITSGATPRPSTSSPAAWDDASLLARYFLARHMSAEVNQLMDAHKTAPALWAALAGLYHQHTASHLLQSLDAIRSLRHTGAVPFREHLASFEARWDDLRFRSEDAAAPVPGAPSSLETAMRVLTTSDEAKREFLVASMHASGVEFVRELEGRLGDELEFGGLRTAMLGFCAWEEAQSPMRGGL